MVKPAMRPPLVVDHRGDRLTMVPHYYYQVQNVKNGVKNNYDMCWLL